MSEKLTIKITKLPLKKTPNLVVFVHEDEELTGEAADLFSKAGLNWKALSDAGDFCGKSGQVLDILTPKNLPIDRLLVLGIGKPQGDTLDEESADTPSSSTYWAEQGGRHLSVLKKFNLQQVALILDAPDMEPDSVAQICAGITLANYNFDKFISKKTDDENPEIKHWNISIYVKDKPAVEKAVAFRSATVDGTLLARDLVNEPPNSLGPVEFAKVASSLSSLGVDVEILNPSRMKKLGMEALLAVGQGSRRPAQMAIMSWAGGKKRDKPLAIVGKGVVFDTGGVSIKPAGGMQDMKGDMGGAAAVVGLMKTLALRKAKVNVVGVIGLAENMADGNAYRPGDIVTAMSGTTIEVINTDAEGRLVLADALWYTQQKFNPVLMINLATLTGAIMGALGQDYAGLFSNNDQLAKRLSAAGIASGEKLWRMPMGPAYEKLIKSRFADIKNIGGRYGGAITAAQFLQHFVNEVPWAHLDIAGTGFGTPSTDINKSWASGFGVALLDRFINENYEK